MEQRFSGRAGGPGRLLALTAALGAAGLAGPARGLAGGRVVAGEASIAPGPGPLTITQSSPRAAIDWGRFDLGPGEAVRIVQPSATSILLLRVRGDGATQLRGRLSANGRVWLINRRGIRFGATARVDVAGLVATSADIDDGRFLAGDYRFDIPGDPRAVIDNAGRITAAEGGSVTFVAPRVTNGVLAPAPGPE